MTEEQLIQEYSDAVCPKIAKALISEIKKMLIEKALLWLDISLSRCIEGYQDDKVIIRLKEKILSDF